MPTDSFEKALNSLSVFREIDMVIVPTKAHKQMARAGAIAGGIDEVTAMIVYETMVSASIAFPVENTQATEMTNIAEFIVPQEQGDTEI